MKTLKPKYLIVISITIVFLATIILYANESGRTGRTLKTSAQGCGGCHGSSFTSDVSVLLHGPDTVYTGQTVQYSLSVTKPTKTGAGLDIAVRQGSLSPVSPNIHLANNELTHNNNIPMTAGTATVQFNYIAPSSAGIDTIWATGLATNSDGSTSGDDWNWSPNKRIIVLFPTGIKNISTVNEFDITQNYPNPFNPVTNIKIELFKPMNINITILDALGNQVSVLNKNKLSEGEHLLKWDASNYPSGVYYYRIEGNNFSISKKMMLIK